MQKYSVNQHQISNILSWVQTGAIAVPEIQRPFVWEKTKIRDLIDSLYNGYPVGYIIVWQNPSARLRDGREALGKKILIDGQQRITALNAAILGNPIVDKDYKEITVRISFNPQTEEFRTRTAVAEPDWIEDIAELMRDDAGYFDVIDKYLEMNPKADKKQVQNSIQQLVGIKSKQIGLIELDATLDIETVTEIFIRINSQGVPLSQADFVMSKVAAYGDLGVNIRKTIDYFCHLARSPHVYKSIIENDKEFAATEHMSRIAWLRRERDDIYDPDYKDLVRTVTLNEFERGSIADLVSLLSGRDFETKTYKHEIAVDSFKRLDKGVSSFVNETNFKRFAMIMKSAGYIDRELMTAQNALNFAYGIFLKLREMGHKGHTIERYVRRWFVMSMLTARHSGSFETTFEADIKRIKSVGIKEHLQSIEEGAMGEDFWTFQLVQELEKSSTRNPFINAFFAAQVYNNEKGFLSKDIKVRDMIEQAGDIHHIFPRKYLIKHGFEKNQYNQIANYAQAQTEINIAILNKEPKAYMAEVTDQIKSGKLRYGNIDTESTLKNNLRQNAVRELIFTATYKDYEDFLEQRRKLMAKKIEKYYKRL